jgi:hypothetical protein
VNQPSGLGQLGRCYQQTTLREWATRPVPQRDALCRRMSRCCSSTAMICNKVARYQHRPRALRPPNNRI